MAIYKTSEWVSLGHPDKMADYVSEYILDRLIEQDTGTRYALEVQIKSGNISLAGEVTTKANTSIEAFQNWAREAIKEIGYSAEYQQKFGAKNTICDKEMNVTCNISCQSPNIAEGVAKNGWGDQGIFFGYYCNETTNGQGAEYHIAKDIGQKLYMKALSPNSCLGLDIKTQVTICMNQEENNWVIEEIIIAVPMVEGQEKKGKAEVKEILKEFSILEEASIIINGTGTYTQHGPIADSGTTGRKLVVDFYGGRSRIGGGSPWTKDGTKADLTLNLLAFELAKDYFNELKEMDAPIHHAETELSCCIGRKEVLMQMSAYDNEGNPFHTMNDLKPIKYSDLIKRYKLNTPVFAQMCREGLFTLFTKKTKEKKQ